MLPSRTKLTSLRSACNLRSRWLSHNLDFIRKHARCMVPLQTDNVTKGVINSIMARYKELRKGYNWLKTPRGLKSKDMQFNAGSIICTRHEILPPVAQAECLKHKVLIIAKKNSRVVTVRGLGPVTPCGRHMFGRRRRGLDHAHGNSCQQNTCDLQYCPPSRRCQRALRPPWHGGGVQAPPDPVPYGPGGRAASGGPFGERPAPVISGGRFCSPCLHDFVSDLGVRRPRRHIDPQYQRVSSGPFFGRA